MTGHDIARELERLGVPEGMVVWIPSRRGIVGLMNGFDLVGLLTNAPRKWSMHADPDHPRAPEAATRLLRAYRAAQEWSDEEQERRAYEMNANEHGRIEP